VKEEIGNLVSLLKLSPTKVIAPAERYHPSPALGALIWNSHYHQQLPRSTRNQRGKAKWETIKIKAKATPEAKAIQAKAIQVRAIQVRAISRARVGRAAGQTMLPIRADKKPLARATLVRETRAKGILETLVKASQDNGEAAGRRG
jgi:hypothetical protein